MPKYNYPTIQRDVTSDGKYTKLGIYRTQPGDIFGINKLQADYDNASEFRKEQLKILLSGVVTANPQAGNVDLDYGTNLPDGDLLKPSSIMVGGTVETGGGGRPASPWVPNPTSPGEGSANPSDQGEAPTAYGTAATNSLNVNNVAVDGGNNPSNPSVSSTRMSKGMENDTSATYSSLGVSPATRAAT